MKRDFLRKMQERVAKSFLDMLILTKLRKEPKSAYGIFVSIDRKLRFRVNSSTVYSIVYSLMRDGLIENSEQRRAKVYRLTDKGERTVQAFLNTRKHTQAFLASLLESLGD